MVSIVMGIMSNVSGAWFRNQRADLLFTGWQERTPNGCDDKDCQHNQCLLHSQFSFLVADDSGTNPGPERAGYENITGC